MAGDDDPENEDGTSRRRVLGYGLLAALGATGIGMLSIRNGEETPTTPTLSEPSTPSETLEEIEYLVERFAPDLYFGRRERWYPTDPRAYASDHNGQTVVRGFDALGTYASEIRESGTLPHPTVFYHVAPVDDTIVALQYWMYSVFDQFTVNFHWHDWELLQVFVDTDTTDVLLLAASSHSRRCPNNEVLNPALGVDDRPVVLSEVGSHSSATDVNQNIPSFERVPTGGFDSDITNAGVRPLADLLEQPFVYGLPRDEGARLPYVMPELDGQPLAAHPDLPGIEADDFVPEDITVHSWRELSHPPTDLPTREPGLVVTPSESATPGDVTYDLVPIQELSEQIDEFTGPQLSFEFAIPGFVEDLYADHITSVGVPWEGRRFTVPTADITDPAHRRAIQGVAGESTNQVVGVVTSLSDSPDGAIDAVESEDRTGIESFITVSRFPLPVEVACLLRSDPVAVPTARGVFRFVNIEPGEHELVINGPGIAPYAERFEHSGGLVRPGADGRVTMVATEDARRIRVDRQDTTGIRSVRVTERFVGPVYDGRPFETDRCAIPVHRSGQYTVQIVDRNGIRGTAHVGPNDLEDDLIIEIEIGKESEVAALASSLEETTALARDLEGTQEQREQATDDEQSVVTEFRLATTDAVEASDTAAGGDGARANELVEQVVDRLLRIRSLLREPDRYGYTDAAGSLLWYRAGVEIDQAESAYGTPIENS